MKIQAVESQTLATLHLVDERGARLLQPLRFGMAKVYKVAVVRQNLMWCKAIFVASLAEGSHLLVAECGGCPLTLILGKEGESRRPYLESVARGVINTARCADVSSKIFHIVE